MSKHIWLVDVATWLNVPVVATVEDGRYPELAAPLCGHVSADRVLLKTSYNAASDANILRTLRAAGRSSIVVTGSETDVCVAQTAIGLLQNGFRVAFIEDVLIAPAGVHMDGVLRMRAAGAVPLSLRALYYEWMGDVRIERRFRSECPALFERSPIVY